MHARTTTAAGRWRVVNRTMPDTRSPPPGRNSSMRTRLRHGLGVGVAVVVAAVAIPNSAYALGPLGPGSSTLWKNYSPSPDGKSHLCMGVAGGSTKVQDGAAIVTWTCNDSPDQTWILADSNPDQPDGTYLIENSVATTECL